MSAPSMRGMSVERDELHRLVDELPEGQIPLAVADIQQHGRTAAARAWPPSWFGAAEETHTNTAANVDEFLREGFGRSA